MDFRFPVWLFAPVLFFVLCQCYIHWSLDISDMPGAAGTWSLYLAAVGTPRDDVAALVYQMVEQYTNLTYIQMYHIVSLLFGVLAVLGGTLSGYAFGESRGGFYTGFLFASWPLTHLFSLLSGNDPISLLA